MMTGRCRVCFAEIVLKFYESLSNMEDDDFVCMFYFKSSEQMMIHFLCQLQLLFSMNGSSIMLELD